MFDATKYVTEEHEVITADGYKLTVFRVNLNDAEKSKLDATHKKNIGRVVVLQHGLLDSSDGFFWNNEKSVGFHLLDQGYDIWSPNNR
jgi:pimeloyl-ACP methyl ester carboxylesterase